MDQFTFDGKTVLKSEYPTSSPVRGFEQSSKADRAKAAFESVELGDELASFLVRFYGEKP